MDKDWQNTLFEGWTDPNVVLGRDNPDDARTSPSPTKTPTRSTNDGKNGSPTPEESTGGPEAETGMSTEQPSTQPQTPTKPRPASMRPSVEMFQSPTTDGDDSKSKQSRASVGDNSSDCTVDSNDEPHLSDTIKKIWKGIRRQGQADPLEQWMVKHSGGTLRDAPVSQPSGKSSDKP